MMKTAFSYLVSCFCFFVSVSVYAQGMDFLKDMLRESFKESIKTSIRNEMKIDPLYENLLPDSTWKTIEINVNKQPLPRLGFNHKQNCLYMNYKDSLSFGPTYTLSPNVLTPYSNWQEYDPTSTETPGDILSNAFLRPIASFVMINPIEFFNYLMDIGVLPNEPLPTRQSKHEKAVKFITKEIYPNDE